MNNCEKKNNASWASMAGKMKREESTAIGETQKKQPRTLHRRKGEGRTSNRKYATEGGEEGVEGGGACRGKPEGMSKGRRVGASRRIFWSKENSLTDKGMGEKPLAHGRKTRGLGTQVLRGEAQPGKLVEKME